MEEYDNEVFKNTLAMANGQLLVKKLGDLIEYNKKNQMICGYTIKC